MRNFIAFLGVALILLGLSPVSDLTRLEENFPDAEYIFYLSASEVRTDISDARDVRANLKDVRGEAVRLYGEDNADTLLEILRITIIKTEFIGEIKIIYGFSPYLSANTLDKSKINIQIAINGQTVTAASPIIYGGY